MPQHCLCHHGRPPSIRIINTNYGPTWQSLASYATAVTAEPADVVYANDANNYAYVYSNGWVNSPAAVAPPRSLPVNSQFLRPMAIRFISRSAALLSMAKIPASV